MRKLIVLLFVVVCGVQYAGAQSLHVDSTRFITGTRVGTGIEYALPTTDKGVLFVGLQYGNPGGPIPPFPLDTVLTNVFIGKIDSNRQISWLKIYGGTQDEVAISACETPDGGFAVLASTSSSNGNVTGFKGAADIWLLRIDAFGNLLWQKTYGSSENDAPESIANTPDNGFIILGVTNGSDGDVPFHYGGFFSSDWLVIKTDSMGNVQWSKDLGTSDDEGSLGSILAIDTAYYLINTAVSKDHDCTDTGWHSGVNTYADYYILKLDANGNVLWNKSYGGSKDEYAQYAIFDTRDSSIVITGTTASNDYMVTGYHAWGDMWVIKVDKNGTLIWQKTLGSLHSEDYTSICKSEDGGYIAYCTTMPNGIADSSIQVIGGHDLWVFALNNAGNVLTNKIFGGTNVESSYSIVPILNGYVATGISGSSVFTEGICNVNYSGAFVSYLDYWPLAIQQIHSQAEELNIYPNPANTFIKIALPENETGNLGIYNSMGQMVYSGRVQGHQSIEVAIADWAEGVYSIRWNSDNGSAVTGKFLKM